MYNFTNWIDRENTGAYKWELMKKVNPNVEPGIAPLSIADMEFVNAPEILEGLQEFLNDAVLGYTIAPQSYLDAVVKWQKQQYDWDIKENWIVHTNNVVTAIYAAIRKFTKKDEGVMIFSPVYTPFSESIHTHGRKEVSLSLINNNGRYEIDFEAFEEAAKKDENKMLIFCNPHNPVGRVWTEEELSRVAEICAKNNVLVFSDEIWRDFTMPGYDYTPIAKVSSDITPLLITGTSTSKTFNLAGLKLASIIIEDEALRQAYQEEIAYARDGVIGPLAYKGVELAYTKALPWLKELLSVIDTNQHLVHNFFEEKFPTIKAPLIEGTYVQWVDMNSLGLSDEELADFVEQEAQFFTDHGYTFGEEGTGFERINLAIPTEQLEDALKRLEEALEKRN